jgi:hypothetical protein
MASGSSEPAAPVAGLHLHPLFTAVFAPSAHEPQRLIGVNLCQGRSLLIGCSLQRLRAGAEQWLTGAAAAHFRLAPIRTTSRQRHRCEQGKRKHSPPTPSVKTRIC